MRNPHFAIADTLSRTRLAEVRGGLRLTIPQSTVGVRPEDCGPAGPAWTVQLHGTQRVGLPFFKIDVPYTVQATQCK
jgi:hypothetical protein